MENNQKVSKIIARRKREPTKMAMKTREEEEEQTKIPMEYKFKKKMF
jgi:hypothetical protein